MREHLAAVTGRFYRHVKNVADNGCRPLVFLYASASVEVSSFTARIATPFFCCGCVEDALSSFTDVNVSLGGCFYMTTTGASSVHRA